VTSASRQRVLRPTGVRGDASAACRALFPPLADVIPAADIGRLVTP